MENIQMFLTFCENYGVPKTNLCQTVDLYEGTNMPQFLSCVQCLGTEVSSVTCQSINQSILNFNVAYATNSYFKDHKGGGDI